MNEIGKKIKEIRKKKGLSQEELAESSKVNLRTIQRIENDENEPRGKTLNLICEVLDINTEDILDYGKYEDKSYLIVFHLSVLVFLVIPVGNIILPLILWIAKKDKIIGLKEIGANLLNYQIVWSIFTFISLAVFFVLKIMHYGQYLVPFYVFISFYILNVVLPVFFAIKISRETTSRAYPNFIRIVK
ncbi:helix-turn-helix domain-containing protein [Flavobacterium sp. KACC 22761]|uniref:helix-turn-helix domain-containing protein n=1 Tax=Flavobacterium sp. KACC 22761 TaxID=3092665 RepID=UPI002A74950F|nr:helix-turn-helix domain-containing protein [Flavobacterium sp. KACC 22761]WPO78601.1 helix-turn-helix domain-containing protein [Flavobacterium sp. KACC 22761]